MKLTMLGTGHATVTRCYNTCFLLEEGGRMVLVDGGGGNTIQRQLLLAGCDWKDIHHVVVSHCHLDHVLGVLWMLRLFCQGMRTGSYAGEAWIYSHRDVLDLLRDMAARTLSAKYRAPLDETLHLPGLAFLDIYFLHTAFGKDRVGRVADIFGYGIVEEGFTHFRDDNLFGSAHTSPTLPLRQGHNDNFESVAQTKP